MRFLFGLIFYTVLFALVAMIGRWAVGYTLYVWSAEALAAWEGLPLVAQYVIGLFGSEIAFPAAIISWVVQLFTNVPIL